ncbi:MAG: NUDIX domain-containing protein [Lachnospiraceae bacterium]|nr:NUDIX domain-containing protein [Lachnospiraceae bacterium]
MKDIIERYKGNYITEMRKDVGHAPLMVISCGVIIENEKGEILLQKRRDNGLWAIIGGSMEIGEKFIETVKREAFEEAGIEIKELTLFGIYSGEDRIITYPNGDICCGTGIIFKTTAYSGEIQNNTEEALEHRFFDKTNLPDNMNKYDKQIIIDWTKNFQQVIVD